MEGSAQHRAASLRGGVEGYTGAVRTPANRLSTAVRRRLVHILTRFAEAPGGPGEWPPDPLLCSRSGPSAALLRSPLRASALAEEVLRRACVRARSSLNLAPLPDGSPARGLRDHMG